MTQGGSTSYTATLGAVNGFNSATTLTVTGLPTGTSGIFTANPVTGAGTSTLNVTTSSTTPTGSYPLTITGTSGNLTHATTVTLVVNAAPQPDFTLTASPSTQTVTQGGSTSYTATLGALNGFTGATTLTVTGLPTGASGTFTANPVTGAGASTLNVTTSSSTPAGSYTVSIKGTSGSLSHTATVTLVVNSTSGTADFSLAVTPSSQTVAQGGTTTYTVQITALNGFTGTVSLDGSGLPGGASGAFSTTSIRGSGASTVTIRPNTIATGTYSLTVIGTSGSLRHTATMTLVVTR